MNDRLKHQKWIEKGSALVLKRTQTNEAIQQIEFFNQLTTSADVKFSLATPIEE